MVRTVEGLALSFASGEERNVWYIAIGCVLGFLPFEAAVVYHLVYGEDDDGDGGGYVRGKAAKADGPRGGRRGRAGFDVTDVIAVPGDLEAEEPGPPSPATAAAFEVASGGGRDKDGTAAYTSGHMPRAMPAVEGLRILGAVHIVAFHFYLFEHKATQCVPCHLGEWWVHIFFVITGLVSYRSASRQKTSADAHAFGGLRLLERRLKSIYPITFVSFAIMYFVRLYNGAYVTSVSMLRVLTLSTSWTPPFDDSSLLNGPAWYISNLVPFWLMLPHWARALRRASRRGLFVMLAVLYVGSFAPFVTRYLVLDDPTAGNGGGKIFSAMCNFSPYVNIYHVPMGLVLAAMLDRKYVDGRDGTSTGSWLRSFFERCGASIGVASIALFFIFYKADSVSMLYKGPLSYPLLYVLFIGTSQVLDVSARLLAFLCDLGQLSLPLYLLHIPIQVLDRRPGENINVHVYYAVVLPCSLLAGSIIGAFFQSRWTRYCLRKAST